MPNQRLSVASNVLCTWSIPSVPYVTLVSHTAPAYSSINLSMEKHVISLNSLNFPLGQPITLFALPVTYSTWQLQLNLSLIIIPRGFVLST